MNKRGLSSVVKVRLTFLILCTFLMLMIIAYLSASNKWQSEGVRSLSIEDTMESTNKVEIEESMQMIDEEPITAMAYMALENNEDTENNESTENGIAPRLADGFESQHINDAEVYQALSNDIEAIKKGDTDVIARYFGVSDVFIPETVADRVSATTLTLVSNDSSEIDHQVIVHVCTIDYSRMNSDYLNVEESKRSEIKEETDESEFDTVVKKEVTRNLINGDYDVCFNIPINVLDNELVVSEALKQAITGGWYSGAGVTLSPVECIIN